MPEENMIQEFRLEKIDEIRNNLIEEINRNELMSKKHIKVSRILNYINHSLIVISTMHFHFCFGFFSWCFYRDNKFCNLIKNLCNNCRN